MILFDASIRLCGFSSHSEAADFLGQNRRTVKNWCLGRDEPSEDAWRALDTLYSDIVTVSHQARHAFDFDTSDENALMIIAREMFGSLLPASALSVAMAMAKLAREPQPV